MKPVMQTKRGGADVPPEERGDCWPACLASILELPIEATPVPHSDDPAVHWWDQTQEMLAPLGYYAVVVDTRIWPSGYWLAVVPSLNLRGDDGEPLPHVVVMLDGQIAHDPCLGDRYAIGTSIEDLEVREGYVLVPLEYGQVAA